MYRKKIGKNSQKRPKRIIFFPKIRLLTLSSMAFDTAILTKKKHNFRKKIWKGCDSLILIDFAEIVREAKAIRLSPLAILL